MEKLELKHLAPYLPYGLKWTLQELKIFTMSGITRETLYTTDGGVFNWVKCVDLPQALFPCLRPLSDLTKKIEVNGKEFVPLQILTSITLKEEDDFEVYGIIPDYWENILKLKFPYDLEYYFISELLSWHFDVFNLISKKLAIDINTLKI